MSFLIIVTLVVILIIQSRSQKDAEQKAYRQGYSEGYWCARRESDPAAMPVQPDHSTISSDSQPQATSPSPTLDTTADKQKTKIQTLNLTLYAASLLLVGGIVLFTDTILSHDIAMFIVAWTIVAAYYAVGMVLYEASAQLKPVAAAFVGTALAGLPFVGMLFTTLLGMSGSSAWLITSAVALLAYIYAALRLRSQVLGYAVTAVVVSCGLSLASALGVGLVWFFVVTLAVAASMNLVAGQLLSDERLAHMFKPVSVVGRWLPLATLVSALLMSFELSALDQTLIWLVAGGYYLTQAVYTKSSLARRNENWIMSRIVLSFAGLFLVYALSKSAEAVVVAAAVIGLVQVLVSVRALSERSTTYQHEVSLWFGLGLALLAPTLLVVGTDDYSAARIVTLIALTMTVVTSLGSAYALRRVELAYMATAALVVLPGLAVYHFLEQAGASAYMWAYVEVALIAVGVRIWRESAASLAEQVYYQITIGLLTIIAAIAALALDDMPLQIAGLSSIAAIYYALAWCDRRAWLLAVGNLVTLGVLRASFEHLGLTAVETAGALAFGGTVLFSAVYIWLQSQTNKYRSAQNVFLLSAIITSVLFGVVSMVSSGLYTNLAMLGMVIGGSLILVNRERFGSGTSLLLGVILVTLALQRMFALAIPDVSLLFYAHWWAIVLWLIGYIENQAGHKKQALTYAYVGLSIVSLFGLGYALTEGSSWYQLLFIIEHSLLLIVGLLLSWRNLTLWGAIGVTLSILWMFRDYTSIFLTLIGLIIILVVIWVVRRESNKSA